MSKLSAFLLTEQLSDKQVIALHRFNELFKAQITVDVTDALVASWTKAIKQLPKVKPAAAEEAILQNPKVLTDVTVVEKPVKLLAASELGRSTEVSPAVKLPLLLSRAERTVVINKLFDIAQDVFNKIIHDWSEAFMFERSGRLATEFRVRRDARSVRLSLVTSSNSVEHETVVYYVAVEHGKATSKARTFDLVYMGVPS
jgi:hypothetical protein